MLVVGGLILFLEYKLSDIFLFILLAIPTLAFFSFFSFFKINGMPFHYFVLNMVQTFKKPHLRIWIRDAVVAPARQKDKAKISHAAETALLISRKPLTGSKLSDIALIIDTGGIYHGEEAELGEIHFNDHK